MRADSSGREQSGQAGFDEPKAARGDGNQREQRAADVGKEHERCVRSHADRRQAAARAAAEATQAAAQEAGESLAARLARYTDEPPF